MTLAELRTENPDIILDEAPWNEIMENANGAAYFYVSLQNGNRPKEQRKVLWAGHVLTAGLCRDVSGDQIILVRLTSNGNARIDTCYEKNAGPDGNAVFYRTRPFCGNDPRNRKPWKLWN